MQNCPLKKDERLPCMFTNMGRKITCLFIHLSQNGEMWIPRLHYLSGGKEWEAKQNSCRPHIYTFSRKIHCQGQATYTLHKFSWKHIFRVNVRFTARQLEARDCCIMMLISGSYPSCNFMTNLLKENAFFITWRNVFQKQGSGIKTQSPSEVWRKLFYYPKSALGRDFCAANSNLTIWACRCMARG